MNECVRHREQAGQKVETSVSGRQVTLIFPERPDTSVSKRVREALIDSYIQKYGARSTDN